MGKMYYDKRQEGRRPMVIVYPDWTGIDDYEEWRGMQIAQWGYVVFVADVYGADVPTGDALAVEVGFTAMQWKFR